MIDPYVPVFLTENRDGWRSSTELNMRLRFSLVVANAAVRFGRYEAAADAYARFLRLEPEHAGVQFHRAWCLVQVPRRRDEGIVAFQRLLKTSPSASGSYLMACALQQQGRHGEAVAAFQEAARLENIDTADFHMNLGASLTALGRWTEAREAFAAAAHLDPGDANAWTNLGVALMETGHWRDALPCHERARRLAAHGDCTNLITNLVELGRLEEAEALLRDILARDSGAQVIKELLAYVLLHQDRHRDAFELAQEVRRTHPESFSARATTADALSELGRGEEAIAEAEAVVSIEPDNAMAYAVLGSVRLKMNDGAAALVAFDRMAECLDRDEGKTIIGRNQCLAGRGLALSLLGDHRGAKAACDEVIGSDPTFFERRPDLAPQLWLRDARERQES